MRWRLVLGSNGGPFVIGTRGNHLSPFSRPVLSCSRQQHPARGDAEMVGVHEQALLSTASLEDFEILRSIGAGNNGQIFEVACTIPQV